MFRTLAALLTIGIAGLTAGQAEQEQGAKARAQQPSDTAKGSSYSAGPGSMSADGRYLVFLSDARDLVPGQVDVKGTDDVFLYDRVTGTTVLVSHAAGSATKGGNDDSYEPVLSQDGRYVAFESCSRNLVPLHEDYPFCTTRIFLYERATGKVTLASRRVGNGGPYYGSYPAISADGSYISYRAGDVYLYEQASGRTLLVNHAAGSTTRPGDIPYPEAPYPEAVMSADGRFVAFSSASTNLIPGQDDNYGPLDVFLYDRLTGVTTLVSHAAGSPLTAGDALSRAPSLSADGRYLAFESYATDLLTGVTDRNGDFEIFLYDRLTGTTSLVTRSPESPNVTSHDGGTAPVISADGSTIAFFSRYDRTPYQIWVYDRPSGQTSFITRSAQSASRPANAFTSDLVLSANGRYLSFTSVATDLVPGQNDRGGTFDVFLHDRVSAATVLVSHAAGLPTKARNGGGPRLSADGSWIAFSSNASDLVADKRDGNGLSDVFLYDRKTATNRVVSLARKP
jgi:Tol biopolymer transport system component